MTIHTDIHRGLLRLLLTMTAVMAAVGMCMARGTDTLHVDIHYPVAESSFHPEFRNNAGVTDSLRKALRHGAPLSIDIVSSSSPDGNAKLNQRLSELRTATALKVLSSIPDMRPDSLTSLSKGADWTGFTPEMKRITRHRSLRRLDGGAAWQLLKDSVFPDLRVSRFIIVTHSPLDMLIAGPTDYYATIADMPETILRLPYGYPEWHIAKEWKPCMSRIVGALRSNLLYDLAAVPNIGIELALPHGWAIGLSGMYAWWSSRKHSRYWHIQAWELFARHYFGECHLSGWHMGLYAQIGRYDICLDGKGYLSGYSGASFFQRPTYGGGLEAGYALRLTERLNLDFTAGAGVLTGQYQTYTATPGHHSVWQSTRQRRYFGPSKAEIALVWLFGKGGER
ncbi:MAG: DUF3575 domain-containing protein [Muribaculaceae bacterium]|nr:DUF3575 domain-containing protein [Muribaculaceae bacterium]